MDCSKANNTKTPEFGSRPTLALDSYASIPFLAFLRFPLLLSTFPAVALCLGILGPKAGSKSTTIAYAGPDDHLAEELGKAAVVAIDVFGVPVAHSRNFAPKSLECV